MATMGVGWEGCWVGGVLGGRCVGWEGCWEGVLGGRGAGRGVGWEVCWVGGVLGGRGVGWERGKESQKAEDISSSKCVSLTSS